MVTHVKPQQTLESILFRALTVLGEYKGSPSQFELVDYLLEQGADPDIKSARRVNCLHVALEFHDLSAITILLLTKAKVDVNIATDRGNTPLYVAIREYGLTWREEQQQINLLRFTIIEKLLARGAKLTLDGGDVQSKEWTEWLSRSADDKLEKLLANYTLS